MGCKLTVDELKLKKSKLEKDLMNLIVNFNDTSGVTLQSFSWQIEMLPNGKTYLFNVIAEIKL